MQVKPIHNEEDLRDILAEISVLMQNDPELGTPDGDRLDVLATLVEAYEAAYTKF